MTLQQAVNQLGEWGAVRPYQNPKDKTFYYRLDQKSQDGQVWVQLSVGTWTKQRAGVNSMGMRITGIDDPYIDSGAWQAQRSVWRAFHLDGLLAAYGVPSDVRFYFSTDVKGKWIEAGRSISYAMHLSYGSLGFNVDLAGLARAEGDEILICPADDSHYLHLEFQEDASKLDEAKVAAAMPVTWQKWTGTDLTAFYQRFADPVRGEGCITTTLEPMFR